MKFSFCTDDEFACDDGSCIDMSLRCDGTTHCEDKSDEEDCQMIAPDIGYNKYLVPPPLKGKQPKIHK